MPALTKIACVVGDADIHSIVSLALEEFSGFTVAVYSRAAQALAEIETFAPQMIILDVMMPGMDGIELFGRLREIPQFKDTPIAFMTAKAQHAEVCRYEALGAIGTVMKPFDPIRLSRQINELREASMASADPALAAAS